jgi:Leucine-rich repeat (LRR) protein
MTKGRGKTTKPKISKTRAKTKPDVRALIEEAKNRGATELVLGSLGGELRELPPEIAGLTTLQHLNLAGAQVSDLAAIAGLTTLRNLSLDRTRVSDITPLACLSALQSLSLADTRVSDVAPLAHLTALQSLRLSGTPVRELAPIAGLTALRELTLDGTQVRDIDPIARFTVLQNLWLSGTPVSKLAPIAKLTALRTLWLSSTEVSDLDPLSHMTRLQDAATSGGALGGSYGLYYSGIPASLTPPFDRLVRLEQPARTVETINELRRQRGLPEHIPKGYQRPADIGEIPAGRAKEQDKKPPRIPDAAPAAIEPIFSKGRISLPADAAAADLSEDTRDAALSALKTDLGELATDVEGEANIDHRAAKLLRDVAALVPQSGPPQDVLFRLAHKEEVLVAYAPTVNNEWPQVLASRYHVVCRQFDRTMRQFPKWREFKRNGAKDQLAPEQLAQAAPIAQLAIDALADKSTEPFVDPKVPQSLEQLAAPSNRNSMQQLATSSRPARSCSSKTSSKASTTS